MKEAWAFYKLDIQNSAQAHQTFASQLVNDLDKGIMKFKDEQKGTRKAVSSSDAQMRVMPAHLPSS